MSIYNPPSKTQSVFNPSNFGGLGTGGQITTDYLDANYIQFPVSQGNATLVGTSVLGDITQQGDFYTTGDLLVNDVNIITEIDAKQTATTNTIIVNVGDNLKDTINNMGVNDTIKVSGGTFTDNISISTDSGTRTQGNVVGEKNKTILSGNLTIRSGVLFSLTNFKITGNTYVNNNTIFLPFESITQSFTNCEFKMIELRGGNQTLTFTDCKINNSFRSLNASITGIINFIRCDFTGSSFNLLHPENKNAIVMTDCIGLPDDVALDTQNYLVKGITGYTTKLGAFLSHSYTANETPTLTNELSSKSYVDSQVGTKQDTIEDDDLTIANTNGLQSALNDKQDTIEDGDLTIAKTDGLQTALDNKYDDTGGTISGSVTITSDLVVGSTNIITELGTKQDEITTDTDLTLNSITTSSLNTSGKVGFDTTNIQFNTLVLRRPTGNDKIILNEIQVWVNDANIMVQPTNNLIGYFADWDTDKDSPLPPLDFNDIIRSVDKVYNNILEINSDFGTHSVDGNALIIKNIPLTNINDIQSIVYYNRSGENRSIGLVLELYNSTNDAGLIYPLASSNVITTYQLRYRYDFPSITSYSGFADGNSIDDIVNDTIALTETIRLSNIEMTGNVDISGDLVVNGVNVIDNITTLQQNNIIYNSNKYGLKSVSNWVSQTGTIDQNWNEVIYASELNLFVAIGSRRLLNTIMTSTNGIDWEEGISYPPYGLFEIAWSPKLSLFVVVFTTEPCVATSPDGKNWTNLPYNTPFTNVVAVTWSEELELFVALSFNGRVMTSPNGTTWTNRGDQLGSEGQSLVWSKELNLLVAVSQSGTNRVATSSDGITWTTLLVSQNAWNDIEWSPSLGLLVAVADSGTGNRVMTSSDGINWVDGSITDRSWESIRWSGDLGIFLIVATDGYIAYSTDGFIWTESVLTGNLRGCCWSPELGTFVIVGEGGRIYSTSLKERKPTSDNVFNNEFNNINESGEWTFKTLNSTDLTSNSITTIGSGTIGGNLTISGSLTNRNQPCFKATTTQTLQPSVDTNIIFNNPITDTDSGYNSSTGEYTIQSAGNWYFYYSFQSNGVAFKVELQQEGTSKDQVFTDLALTSGTNLGCKGMVIIPCSVGNVIRVRVKSGSVRIENGGFFEFHSFGGFLIG